MGISIFIQTLNEEDNLPGLLDSLREFDDIAVLDSYSSDKTREIAEAFGCSWYEHAFNGRGNHQNWAMEEIDFKHRWVFYLDADERMTPELKAEIDQIEAKWESGEFTRENSPVAYYCGRKNFFRGKWIKHAMPPGNIMRFFQPPHIRFERLEHPTPVVDGKVGYLKEHFLHYNFSKGIWEWIDRHNRYSGLESQETLIALDGKPMRLSNLFSRDRHTRRLELKNISFRLPMRPMFKFLYMYVIGRGFLDGRAGWAYCKLQAMYEFMIILKVQELQNPDQVEADKGRLVQQSEPIASSVSPETSSESRAESSVEQ